VRYDCRLGCFSFRHGFWSDGRTQFPRGYRVVHDCPACHHSFRPSKKENSVCVCVNNLCVLSFFEVFFFSSLDIDFSPSFTPAPRKRKVYVVRFPRYLYVDTFFLILVAALLILSPTFFLPKLCLLCCVLHLLVIRSAVLFLLFLFNRYPFFFISLFPVFFFSGVFL